VAIRAGHHCPVRPPRQGRPTSSAAVAHAHAFQDRPTGIMASITPAPGAGRAVPVTRCRSRSGHVQGRSAGGLRAVAESRSSAGRRPCRALRHVRQGSGQAAAVVMDGARAAGPAPSAAGSRLRGRRCLVGQARTAAARCRCRHRARAVPACCGRRYDPRGKGQWCVTPSWFAAASTVCASRTAMVIGPTPPGTGVIRRARVRAVSKSTSPTLPGL